MRSVELPPGDVLEGGGVGDAGGGGEGDAVAVADGVGVPLGGGDVDSLEAGEDVVGLGDVEDGAGGEAVGVEVVAAEMDQRFAVLADLDAADALGGSLEFALAEQGGRLEDQGVGGGVPGSDGPADLAGVGQGVTHEGSPGGGAVEGREVGVKQTSRGSVEHVLDGRFLA